MSLRWLLLFLTLVFSARAEEAWRLPRGVFPHEIAVLDGTPYVASTEGLWRLDKKGKITRIGGKQRASWPLAANAGRLWWLQDTRVAELNPADGSIHPVRSLATKRIGVISHQHGLFLADDESGLTWSHDGETWRGPMIEAQHGFTLARMNDDWWAFTNPDPENTDKFVLSQSPDLQTWTKAAEFIGRQPGTLAAGNGKVLVSEIGGTRLFDTQDLPRSVFIAVGPADERPAVYFAHGCFWLQGERDGLWRSDDGLDWQNLRSSLAPLEAPLVQIAFAPDALVLAGYTGKVVRVSLNTLPSKTINTP